MTNDFTTNLTYVQNHVNNVLKQFYCGSPLKPNTVMPNNVNIPNTATANSTTESFTLNLVQNIVKQAFTPHNSLNEAINYTLFNTGKKLRPFLVWSTGKVNTNSEKQCFYAGAVLEMLHTYSLIHDDLPCMDNDTMRHGKPSLHVKYNESIAVLTGDALLTDAFKYLTSVDFTVKPTQKITIINLIAESLGSNGMVLGQILDLNAIKQHQDLVSISHIHYLKTAKFMELAIIIGGIIAEVKEATLQKLQIIGKNLGLSYQIIDDINDADEDDNNNICKVISKEKAKSMAINLLEESTKELDNLSEGFIYLKQFISFLLAKL